MTNILVFFFYLPSFFFVFVRLLPFYGHCRWWCGSTTGGCWATGPPAAPRAVMGSKRANWPVSKRYHPRWRCASTRPHVSIRLRLFRESAVATWAPAPNGTPPNGERCGKMDERIVLLLNFPYDRFICIVIQCSTSCGKGMRHRRVFCQGFDGRDVGDAECPISEKPASSDVCDMGSCSTNTWFFTEWSGQVGVKNCFTKHNTLDFFFTCVKCV